MHPITKETEIRLRRRGLCPAGTGAAVSALQGPSGGNRTRTRHRRLNDRRPSASAGSHHRRVDVDPPADSFELAGKTLSAGDCASIASLRESHDAR